MRMKHFNQFINELLLFAGCLIYRSTHSNFPLEVVQYFNMINAVRKQTRITLYKLENHDLIILNKTKISGFYGALLLLRSYSDRTELILLSLTYNPLNVSISSAQLLNAGRKSKRSSRYHFLSLWYDPAENQIQSTMLRKQTL